MAVYHESRRQIAIFAGLLAALPLVRVAELATVFRIEGVAIYGNELAAVVCLLAAGFAAFLLPFMEEGRSIRRPDEAFMSGLWLYPLSLAFAFLLLPTYAVAGGWAAMAAGDTAANVIGRRSGFLRLAWNREKTVAGFVAFVAAATPVTLLMLFWARFPPEFAEAMKHPIAFRLTVAILGSLAGAFLESFPWDVGDNFAVPLGSAVAVVVSAHVLLYGAGLPVPKGGIPPEQLLFALLFNGALGVLVLRLRIADAPGAALGVVMGTIVYYLLGGSGYLLMVVFILGGWMATRIGYAQKSLRGVAEGQGGRRGLRNAAANLGVPVLCTLAYGASGRPEFLLAFAGGLAAAFSDTASSEIGMLSRRPPRLITTGRQVPFGTDGGVTLQGYVAAAFCAAFLAGLAWISGFIDADIGARAQWQITLCLSGVFLAGLAGTTADSVLGATVEGALGIGNDAVNFMATATGAAVAFGLGVAASLG